MRTITTDSHNIFSLITCAEDYGYANDVLFDAFAGMLDRTMTSDEIHEYVEAEFLSEEGRSQGYGEENAENATERLERFKVKYCPEVPR